jgi:hypothetical protein
MFIYREPIFIDDSRVISSVRLMTMIVTYYSLITVTCVPGCQLCSDCVVSQVDRQITDNQLVPFQPLFPVAEIEIS